MSENARQALAIPVLLAVVVALNLMVNRPRAPEPAPADAVAATPKTPPEAIRELQTLLASAIRAPEVAQKLAAQGLELSEKCGEAFRTHICSQYEKYAKAIKEAGIKTE